MNKKIIQITPFSIQNSCDSIAVLTDENEIYVLEGSQYLSEQRLWQKLSDINEQTIIKNEETK